MADTTDRTDPTKAMVARGFAAFMIAATLLLIFNSASLRSAVRDLPPNMVTDRLVLSADMWHGWMEALEVAGVAPELRRPFEALRELTWQP